MMKRCPRCKVEHSAKSTYCKPCNREYMRKYSLVRHHRLMSEAKTLLGGVCVRCGSSDNLEFDHIDPKTKVDSISRMATKSVKAFWLEVAKCQLLCSKCHRVKSIENNDVRNNAHGGGKTGKSNCKCELCTHTVKVYMKTYNNNRKIKTGDASVKHGLPATYNRGCRCDNCKAAKYWYRVQIGETTGLNPPMYALQFPPTTSTQ